MRLKLFICGLLTPPSQRVLFPSTPSPKKIDRSFLVKALVPSKDKKATLRLPRRLLCPHLSLLRLFQPIDRRAAANPPQVGGALSESGFSKVRKSAPVDFA